MNKTISLAIPNFNRVENIVKIAQRHSRTGLVDEIVICDDHSSKKVINDLKNRLLPYSKVKLIENSENLGPFGNKLRTVRNCSNPWVVLCDSDNFIDIDYLNILCEHNWDESCIYCPDAALPHFDFKNLRGMTIDSMCMMSSLLNKTINHVALNAGNYFFNKMKYISVAEVVLQELNTDDLLADVIVFNYYWIAHGNKMKFIPDMKYTHNFHSQDSTWRNNEEKSILSFNNIVERIRKGCSIEMNFTNNMDLRPEAKYPAYPPYHTGLYLEEYFHSIYKSNAKIINKRRKYIDIYWTNLYCNNSHSGIDMPDIQKLLHDNTDCSGSYFTICQHDDGPKEKLPEDTLIFSAGGNRTEGKIVPIPLVCSPIPNANPDNEKKWLASFVGSYTSKVRKKMLKSIRNSEDFYISMEEWSPTVGEDRLKNFIEKTSQSIFTLCPRGYGRNSFRIYEAIQLGSIPVIISDSFYLPWQDEIDWNKISLLVGVEELGDIEKKIKSISKTQIEDMRLMAQSLYKDFFSIDGVCNKIIERLNNEK